MIQEITASLLLLAGSSLMLLASLGLIRFQDPLSRAHALTKATTLGIALLLVALWIFLEDDISGLKILLIIIFCLLTTPLSGHMVASLYYRQLHKKDDLADDSAGSPGSPDPAQSPDTLAEEKRSGRASPDA
jgi:multicomponent Na+:H+ antiporter subunit G